MQKKEEQLSIRHLQKGDSLLLRDLAEASGGTLDVHTPYTYWVLEEYFSENCFIALLDEEPVGFATSVCQGNRGLLWQVGILPGHTGKGMGKKLLDALFSQFKKMGIQKVECTISPKNSASQKMLLRYCEKNALAIKKEGLLEGICHESEERYFIEL